MTYSCSDDFLPQGQSTDDEETIAVAEQELENEQGWLSFLMLTA